MVTRDIFVVANLVVQNKVMFGVCCDDGATMLPTVIRQSASQSSATSTETTMPGTAAYQLRYVERIKSSAYLLVMK